MDIVVSLVRRCKNNDKNAFHDLLTRFEAQLYRICYGYTRDKEASLDIMQEVYIKIYRSIYTFDENKPFYPWAKTITINTCLNYVRDQKKHVQLSLDYDNRGEGSLIEIIADGENVEEIACAKDMIVSLEDCIRSLPDTYRMALALRYIEDMSYDQIASNLELSIGTVKSNISRGRKLLKEKLKHKNLLEV